MQEKNAKLRDSVALHYLARGSFTSSNSTWPLSAYGIGWSRIPRKKMSLQFQMHGNTSSSGHIHFTVKGLKQYFIAWILSFDFKKVLEIWLFFLFKKFI